MSKLHLEKFKQRAISWSCLSAWEWDKKSWAKKYLDGIEEPPTPELIWGKKLADSIEDGTCKIPGLLDILSEKKEFEFRFKFGDIELIGYADAFCDKTYKVLQEVKTGNYLKGWDQKRVDSHGQITLYCLANFIMHKVKPEDVKISLVWLPTEKIERDNGCFDGHDYDIKFVEPIEIRIFKTKRTTKDILSFGVYIKKTYAEMLKFAEAY